MKWDFIQKLINDEIEKLGIDRRLVYIKTLDIYGSGQPVVIKLEKEGNRYYVYCKD